MYTTYKERSVTEDDLEDSPSRCGGPIRMGLCCAAVTSHKYTQKMAAALSSEFSDLVQIKKQLISIISQCKERGLVHSVKW